MMNRVLKYSLIISLLLVTSAVPQDIPTVGQPTQVAGGSFYAQMDESNKRELFRCPTSSSSGCQLTNGTSLDEVVQYFYRDQDRRQKEFSDLWLDYDKYRHKHLAQLKQDLVFLHKLQKIADEIETMKCGQ